MTLKSVPLAGNNPKLAVIGGRLEDDNDAIYAEMHRLSGGRIVVRPSDNAPEGQRKILDHIYAESVDLSGMTQEEAQEALQTRVDEITGYQIVLHMDDMSIGVTAKELGVTGDNDGTIRQAMDVGQVGNVIKRYKVKKALEQENLQLDLSYQVDEESVRKALETYCVALNREVVNYELTRENGEFKITNGARGVTLNEDGSVDKVKDYLEHVWKDGPGSVDLDVEITEPKGSQEELAKVLVKSHKVLNTSSNIRVDLPKKKNTKTLL